MSAAVDVVPRESADCAWKVVQRNAPGAISAIAFTVTPVSVKLRLISPLLVAAVSAIAVLLSRRRSGCAAVRKRR